MKKYIVLALLLSCLGSTQAQSAVAAKDIQSVDVSHLTPEQKAQLMSQVAQLQSEAASPAGMSEKVRNEAGKWAELGSNVGKAAVGAARELGVAANEFVESPLGKVVMAVVIFKLIGSSMIHVLLGGVVLFVFLAVGLYFVLRSKHGEIVYERVPVLWGAWNRRVKVSSKYNSTKADSDQFNAAICAVVGLSVGLTVILSA